ncbi:hypothetical protein [Mycobacterium kyorinense]|uniref:VapC45 PIN like domain-containing protein n=1 Tax=Mycobacterium kyorinense TaxID=487514 RepID=A0A1X1XZC5_9MYCO|nr:hypothetical protein [Mycobacterium kyorinense]ORW04121.1 hypothetical protein AWC14_04400 [Mycobacterium kyorinense]
MLEVDDVVYVVDENLLRLGNGLTAVRKDTAVFSRPPVDELLPQGIRDPEWIPIVGDRGWVLITTDRRLRTRPHEATLAITHKLKVIHLHGDVGKRSAWDQLVRVAVRWGSIEGQLARAPEGPWWLSLRRGGALAMNFAPGAAERA